MLLGVLIALCVINFGILAGGVYASRKASNAYNQITDLFAEIFQPVSPDHPSIFQESVEAITDGIAQKTGSSIQAAIRGSLGGSAKSLNHELEQEAIAADPSLALMEYLPKSLKKNPIAMLGLQRVVGNFLSGSGGGSKKIEAGKNGSGGQAKFNL